MKKKVMTRLRNVAESELVDVVGGSQSIEEWSKEVINQYHTGNRRPDKIVLLLERWGECYNGAVYISKEHFEGRYK
jgi:hypothetical protein